MSCNENEAHVKGMLADLSAQLSEVEHIASLELGDCALWALSQTIRDACQWAQSYERCLIERQRLAEELGEILLELVRESV